MILEPTDVARFSDDQLKLLAVALANVARHRLEPEASFFDGITHCLVDEVKRRKLQWPMFESELLADHEAGGLVEPGSDPVAEAEAEFRRAVERDARRDAGEDVC